MPATLNGGGDKLASGGVRATFWPPAVSEEKFKEAFQDFDLEAFLKKEPTKMDGRKEKTTK
jgi:hypothetical protein